MYIIQTTKRFEKDYKKIFKSGRRDIQKIDSLMRMLANGERLEPKFRDHNLTGDYIAGNVILNLTGS